MDSSLVRQLEEIVSEDISYAIRREQTAFDNLAGTRGGKIILFGAGGQGRRTLSGLRQLGIEPIAFSDNNSAIWGQKVDDLKVIAPIEAVLEYGSKAIFIVTVWRDIGGHPVNEIRSQLENYGAVCVVSVGFLYWKYPKIFLPYFYCDLPHKALKQRNSIIDGINVWADECSKLEYLAQVRLRLSLDFKGLPPKVDWPAYLPNDLFILGENDVFIDCGAFDGDTLRDYLSHNKNCFKKYLAFEPDLKNFNKLKAYRDSLPEGLRQRIEIFNSAVGKKNGTIRFEAIGTAQSTITESGGVEVPIITIDNSVAMQSPTYIKMDIEGAEAEALIGARDCIRVNRPILAICVYHRYDDLWLLPSLIKSFTRDYAFFLRPHRDAGWDLVCYAVPSERLLDAKINTPYR